MIKKLVRQMLTAQILSALTVSLCLLIDNIMIGRYLGTQALAAYGLASPVLLVIGAVGSMLCAGVQVACGKSLGRGSQEETNAGYSSAIAVAAAFSAVFVAVVVALRTPIARLMGADKPALLADTSTYMAGFIIGAPASMGALILVPFLQMAGQSNLLIAAVLGMTVADVGFDLLNVLVFHGGMFGMGLASSLSYYVAMVIGGGYFLSKKCVFRFSKKGIRMDKIRELIAGGVPTVVSMASSVVLIFAVNKILMGTGGDVAVAAFSVVNTIINASNCIATGTGGVSLTLSGVLYNEEDRTGLTQLMRLMVRYSLILGVAVAALLALFAPNCVSLFIPEAGESRRLAVLGLRIMALGLIPCCLNNALKNIWQGAGRLWLMEVISVLENAVLPTLAALLLSAAFGMSGIWFYFFTGELMATLAMIGWVWKLKGGVTWRTEDVLLLNEDFGVPDSHKLEADIRDMAGVMDFSRKGEAFCRSYSRDMRLGTHLALCIEELGGNIVSHGFAKDGKNHLSIRLQCKDGRWTLRFRDDCMAFDPVSHVPVGDGAGVGIPLALKLADEVRYTYSMNLNNLTLILRENR